MNEDGMYASSQALRNVCTQRIVHAAYLDPTEVTADALSRIELFELVDSTVLALQVSLASPSRLSDCDPIIRIQDRIRQRSAQKSLPVHLGQVSPLLESLPYILATAIAP
jgi:hypothetical protein